MSGDSVWRYFVSCYYSEDVRSPKNPGSLAIQTIHQTEASRDIEIEAANSRPDIGVVVSGEIMGTVH